MPDRDSVDSALQRVALLSFLYYPEIHIDEPDYDLASDIEFCLEPLAGVPAELLPDLRDLLGRAIIDPSAYREDVFAILTNLATPDTDAQ